jgi:hypothetical protein
MFAAEQWTMTALGVPPSAQSGPLIMGMRAIAALGLAVPLNLAVLKRLVAMVQTVRAGDPFVAECIPPAGDRLDSARTADAQPPLDHGGRLAAIEPGPCWRSGAPRSYWRA